MSKAKLKWVVNNQDKDSELVAIHSFNYPFFCVSIYEWHFKGDATPVFECRSPYTENCLTLQEAQNRVDLALKNQFDVFFAEKIAQFQVHKGTFRACGLRLRMDWFGKRMVAIANKSLFSYCLPFAENLTDERQVRRAKRILIRHKNAFLKYFSEKHP